MLSGQANKPTVEVEEFVARLTGEQRMLIVLKRELYDGHWAGMLADLQARLAGKPYVFKLAHRIGDDLRRIEHLADFEKSHAVDLSDYVNLDTETKP